MDFLIAKDDLRRCRFEQREPPQPRDGEALLRVDRFGLSANNITYAAFGEAMSYWKFFPAPDGWGRMPVWGFADVLASRADGVAEGMRVYGYLPPSDLLLLAPTKAGPQGFVDASAHRAGLPSAYNSYASTETDPVYEQRREDQQMLLRPLFSTSWLIDDFLRERSVFGADTIVLSSASSKTASGLAFVLSLDGLAEVVGLTSSRGAEYARGLDVYDAVVTYEQLDTLPQGSAVYVDMAGDAAVRAAVHRHYGSQLAHSAVVGATHRDALATSPEPLPGPRPTFFFAPDRVAERRAAWGRAGLEQRIAETWQPYVQWTDGWLRIERASGPEALQQTYLELLDGRTDPAVAHVFSLTA